MKRKSELKIGPQGTKHRVRALHRRLDELYGPFRAKPQREPLDELVLTILSQATNDRNSTSAFERLKERFPTDEALCGASRKEIERAIRPGGLAHNKSKVIVGALRALEGRETGLDLTHLETIPVESALDELTSIPGVGTKTAACVLMFGFGRPVMPVDTHVHRLSRRLGLVKENATADQTFRVLMDITPSELVYPFHVWLIAHGRRVCSARRPACGECSLSDLCPFPEREVCHTGA